MRRSPATPENDLDADAETPARTSVDADHIAELERALTRIAHMLTRARRHDRTAAEAGVEVDRANVPLLRLLAEADEPLRLGEIAARLDVEAPHVTRQVQRLERTGFVTRVPDPCDRRAQRVRLTTAGADAVDAIRAVGRRVIQDCLSTWTFEDLAALARLNHRMVDDFLSSADDQQTR
ncbi:MarR family winged helix-turn-helix transcriptional regulator [Nocardia sp. alder85J]|uniref:MarR family winged helix-turn-helix transcriptional regulator n=1 Tax=Nocardia sp. alder85J TaxID=2862949 RepID=UPI001CD55B64|nr:MarR family transcriptional regulator [Nocardia sp. alder85J]MCX4097318.1 MarR family transcriptional regulator [Nocardia sp. alder85J]